MELNENISKEGNEVENENDSNISITTEMEDENKNIEENNKNRKESQMNLNNLEDEDDSRLKKLSGIKLMLISLFWFSNHIFYAGLSILIIPKYVETIVSSDRKGTTLGEKKKI